MLARLSFPADRDTLVFRTQADVKGGKKKEKKGKGKRGGDSDDVRVPLRLLLLAIQDASGPPTPAR